MPLLMSIAKYDMQGRVVCPKCGAKMPVPHGRFLARSTVDRPACCPAGHYFVIDDDVAYAVNDILSKTREHADNKRILKNFEETPSFMIERPEKGKIIIP